MFIIIYLHFYLFILYAIVEIKYIWTNNFHLIITLLLTLTLFFGLTYISLFILYFCTQTNDNYLI